MKLKNDAILMTFADDTKLLQKISNVDDAVTCQENLDMLFEWEQQSNMKFNAKKFMWIQYGKNSDLKNEYLDYPMGYFNF